MAHAPSDPLSRTLISRSLVDLWRQSDAARRFDVVIVGSGYGGSVAASRLAGATMPDGLGGERKLRVAVLERGSEYLPGEFPSRFGELPRHLRMGLQSFGVVAGNRDGLFDVRVGDDVMALVGNGLGGGSLINAGVLLQPDPDDFPAGGVLRGLVDDLRAGEDSWYGKATEALGGVTTFTRVERVDGVDTRKPTSVANSILAWGRRPDQPTWPAPGPLSKTAALASMGQGRCTFPPITVAMREEPNSAGVTLPQCTLCGDCMTGCNVGAKNSLDANLLHAAHRRGCAIYTGASVLSLRRADAPGGRPGRTWALSVVHTDPSLQKRETQALTIFADKVILAAGTLGSTEILMRSRSDTLVFSSQLGSRFSCNGDNIAAVQGLASPTHGSADENDPLGIAGPGAAVGPAGGNRGVGPTITGALPRKDGDTRGAWIQEFAVPGAMRQAFDEIITTTRALHRLPDADLTTHSPATAGSAELDPHAVQPGAMARTLLVGLIGHDAAAGALYLSQALPPTDRPAEPGAIGIRWPDARSAASLDNDYDRLAEVLKDLPGACRDDPPVVVPNPLWKMLPDALVELIDQPRGPVLTVHPLGGCPMGRTSADGVVDDHGRVFDASAASAQGSDWQGSLVVLDGAIIPGSLGANPALTITATAMRAMPALMTAWGATAGTTGAPPVTTRARIPMDPDSPWTPGSPGPQTQVEIVERLTGPATFERPGGGRHDCVVELTLAYQEVPLRSLMSTLSRRLPVKPADPATRLRIYDARDWHDHWLGTAGDDERRPFVRYEATVSGYLEVLNREASTTRQRRCRSLKAWWRNRGKRDIYQRIFDADGPRPSLDEAVSYARSLWHSATRAGEVRRFDYDLRIDAVLAVQSGWPLAPGVGSVVHGAKRLTYGRRANPWRQLTRLTLTRIDGLAVGTRAVLELDPRFLASRGAPLLRVTRQRDHAQAMLDMASFGLHMTRLMLGIHLWTFRKPDRPLDREPDRRPGRVPGLESPTVVELFVDRMRPRFKQTGGLELVPRDELPGEDARRYLPVTIRLTRYQPPASRRKADAAAGVPRRPALVMIHGYSVSGNTFTHPSIPVSAVQHFCGEGREVWVLDLRTSTALPTAVLPWAMEEVALVDIPAALLHVARATGGPVDVLAHCIGAAMLSMALLTRPEDIRSKANPLGNDVHLTDEQLGTLDAFNRRTAGGAHPCVRKVALSQKGPVIRYTDDNVFRAFAFQTLRRLLFTDAFQFRPPRDPGIAEQLLDRLLSSIPYPDDDYDVDNPGGACDTAPWTGTRHRMDALYGRDFSGRNLTRETLKAIDDLFGPINFETVSQTIHFARMQGITDRAGRGGFVTRGRMRERWAGIDTMAFHGRDNGLADPATQDRLGRLFRGSGLPLYAPDPDRLPYRDLGHQDTLIGRTAVEVFRDVEGFLARGPLPPVPAPLDGVVLSAPWIGPRLDVPMPGDPAGQRLRIACMARPDQGRGTLVLVAAVRTDVPGRGVCWAVDPTVPPVVGDSGHPEHWLFATPPATAATASTAVAGVRGWLAFIAYPYDEANPADYLPPTPRKVCGAAGVPGAPAAVWPAPFGGAAEGSGTTGATTPGAIATVATSTVATAPPGPRVPTDDDWLVAIDGVAWPPAIGGGPFLRELDALVASLPEASAALCFVAASALERAERLHSASAPLDETEFAMALGACQYPAGMLDALPAARSLATAAARAGALQGPDDPASPEPVGGAGRSPADIGLVVLAGDQIYADATAGLVDPDGADELFDLPHQRAFRQLGMRRLMRQVPALMHLDDHEIVDNWAPLPPAVDQMRPGDTARGARRLEAGVRTWARFQRMRPLVPGQAVHGAGDLAVTYGGHPFFFLDTRTGRQARGDGVPIGTAPIVTAAQLASLTDWLAHHGDAVKFIVTPSLLLPRRRTSSENVDGSELSDAWDGFPASMHQLLHTIRSHEHRRTVFLSGDEHHSLHATVRLTGDSGPEVSVLSVHGSALYAPFPFANGMPIQLAKQESIPFRAAGARDALTVSVDTTFAPPGDGFVQLSVIDPQGPATALRIRYVRPHGGNDHEYVVPLC